MKEKLKTKHVISFLLSSIIHMIVLTSIIFFGGILVFGIFDTTSTINEFETQNFKQLVFNISISLFLIIIIIFLLGYEKKFRLWGGILSIIIFSITQLYHYQKDIRIKKFDKEKWLQSEHYKFIEARSIVLNNSFKNLNKEMILSNLDSPNYIESNIFNYEINNLSNWKLSFTFDSCCVIKTELIREPWNL